MFGNVSSDLSYPCAHQASAHHHHLGQGWGGGQLSDEDASQHVDTSAASEHVDTSATGDHSVHACTVHCTL